MNDKEQYCKELNLIPIKTMFVYTDVDFRNSCKVNFNSEYGIEVSKAPTEFYVAPRGIEISDKLYKIVSFKRSEPLFLAFNEQHWCFCLSMNGKRYYVGRGSINSYLNYINKRR